MIGDVHAVTNSESFFILIGIFIGVTINAVIIGNLGAIVADLDSHGEAFRSLCDEDRHTMDKLGTPKKLQTQVIAFNEFKWTLRHGANPYAMLQSLPPTLRSRVMWYIRKEFLYGCEVLNACPEVYIYCVCLCVSSLNRSILYGTDQIEIF